MAKQKYVMSLDIRDVLCATRNMNWEQQGIYLELLTLYASGIEISASAVHAKAMLKASEVSEASLKVVLAAFDRSLFREEKDQDKYGLRIFDERIEPLFEANRECTW